MTIGSPFTGRTGRLQLFRLNSSARRSFLRLQNTALDELFRCGSVQKFLIQLVLELGPLQLLSRSLQCRSNIPLFENVTILQFLSVRTLGETFLQALNGFRVQGVLAGWTVNERGALGGSSDGVGGRH